MAPEPQESDAPEETGTDPFAHDELAAIDSDLMRGMPVDARYESGVPEGQRAGALDFIQMSGLTRPAPQPAREAAPYNDTNTSEPLSFYEAGVSDVDERMSGDQLDGGHRDASLDADLVPDRASEALGGDESPSVRAFREIIAELESGGSSADEDEPDAEPMDSDAASLGEDVGSPPVASAPSAEVEDGTNAHYAADELAASPTEPTPEPAEEFTTAPAAPLPPEPSEPPASDEDDFDALVASLETSAKSDPQDDPSDVTEDWDALLDAVSRGEQETSAPPATESRRNAAPLEQAGQLMSTLGAPAAAKNPPPAPTAAPETVADAAMAYDDYSAAPTRRRSRRHSRVARRGWRIVKVTLLLALVACAGAALWYFTLAPWIEQPEDLEAHANRLLAERQYSAASDAFLRLSRGSSPGAADAQFQAAQVLTLGVNGLPRDEITARFERAKDIFNRFIAENPQHPKNARALCIVGRLEYELGNYDSAITILRDQIQPEDDPAAALAMLRYLARSYVQTNAFEEAETAYLQAATLPGNYSAETDYQELGDMFRTRAALSGVAPTEVESLKNTAAAYWNKGLQVPGIDPGAAKELQERLEWLEFTEKTGGDTPAVPAEAALPEAVPSAPAATVTEQADPGVSPIPAQDSPEDRVEAPEAALGAITPVTQPAENASAAEEANQE